MCQIQREGGGNKTPIHEQGNPPIPEFPTNKTKPSLNVGFEGLGI